MTEQLKDLIKKIQDEGVKTAQDKARSIEEEAKRRAESLLKDAKKEAEAIISAAKEESARLESSTKASMTQAGRDMILALKLEINSMLNKIISTNVRHALASGELVSILGVLIKSALASEEGEVVVSLKKEDKDKLESAFVGELRELVKHGVVLKSAKDITGGFTISYDSGKSEFDFTDKALAEYISLYLKPKLAEILAVT